MVGGDFNIIRKPTEKNNVVSSDGDEPHNLLLNRAASLSEDLEEDEMIRSLEDHLESVVPFERTKIRRPRKDYSTSTRCRSVRIKKLKAR